MSRDPILPKTIWTLVIEGTSHVIVEPTVIGREGDVASAPGESQLAPRHFRLVPTATSMRIEDLHSESGTTVDGEALPAGGTVSIEQAAKISAGGQTFELFPHRTAAGAVVTGGGRKSLVETLRPNGRSLVELPDLLWTLLAFSVFTLVAANLSPKGWEAWAGKQFGYVRHSENLPTRTGTLTDIGGHLKAEESQDLQGDLEALWKESGITLFVLVTPTLNGLTVEEYAELLFRVWKPGAAGKDNGLLFVVSPELRQARLEVGYGLEGQFTDAFTKRTLENEVTPQLRDGRVGLALKNLVRAVWKQAGVRGSPQISREPRTQEAPPIPPWLRLERLLFATWLLLSMGYVFRIWATLFYILFLLPYFDSPENIPPVALLLVAGIFGSVWATRRFGIYPFSRGSSGSNSTQDDSGSGGGGGSMDSGDTGGTSGGGGANTSW